MNLPPVLYQRYFNANGAPLAGGKVYTYQAGTTTPQATYTDQGGLTPNANPLILDANGEAPMWLDPALSYKFVVKDSNDVTQRTIDNVIGILTVGAVNTASLQDRSVTTVKHALNSVDSTILASDASVSANRAVTANHLQDAIVGLAKLDATVLARLAGYRRPNLIWASLTEVDVQANTGTANQTQIVFPDGVVLSVTEVTPTAYRAFKTGQVANLSSTVSPQGGLRTGTLTNNTWYAIYAVKCTGVGQTSNFVLVGDTVLPLTANFATLNANFGTNSWVYLGLVRNGDNGGTATGLLNFVQHGNKTLFLNAGSGGIVANMAGTLLASATGVSVVAWTYAAGTGAAQMPGNVLIGVVGFTGNTGAGIGTRLEPDSAAGGNRRLITANTSGPTQCYSCEAPLTSGLAVAYTSGTSGSDIFLNGFIDGALGVGGGSI